MKRFLIKSNSKGVKYPPFYDTFDVNLRNNIMIKKIIQLTLCISVLTILYSCSSDPVCETCETVVYNDRAAQQGLANNGLEEVSRDYLGVFCDDALDQTRGLKESYQVGFGSIVYTEKVIVECQ